MRTIRTLIFNLSNVFRHGKLIINSLNGTQQCQDKNIHDYYCDAEKPFIAIKND